MKEPGVCYCANLSVINKDDWKIYLPQSMIQGMICWYHMILGHPVITQVYDMIQARFHAEKLCYKFIAEITFVLITVLGLSNKEDDMESFNLVMPK